MRAHTNVVTGELHRVRRGREKSFASKPAAGPERRPARVALALALAHQIQRAIDLGELKDQAEAARRLGMTRARVTQLQDLRLLAPGIQERILFLEALDGVEPLSERVLRVAERTKNWNEQREVLASHLFIGTPPCGRSG